MESNIVQWLVDLGPTGIVLLYVYLQGKYNKRDIDKAHDRITESKKQFAECIGSVKTQLSELNGNVQRVLGFLEGQDKKD